MKKMILGLAMVATLSLMGCGAQNGGTTTTKATDEATVDAKDAVAAKENSVMVGTEEVEFLTGIYKAKITIKDYGTITFEMDADKAPNTVTNFVTLVNRHFYDGLTFHRIIDGFMMQGGDPLGNGYGDAGYTIRGEFLDNGVTGNDQSHVRGAVSMARGQDFDSASSQFFIVQQDSEFLDKQYACFGYVTEGMEIVDQICQEAKVEDNNGTVSQENQPVIESIEIIE